MQQDKSLVTYLLWLGDNGLILGQLLAEWCGKGPYLEEDIALTNISLDLIGQSRAFYSYAAELEGKGRDEDKIAFFRNDNEFFNALLVEQPNGDFAFSMLRQFLFSAFSTLLFEKLSESKDEKLAALAGKSLKEAKYHLRHSQEWVLRLGLGTDESKKRIQQALDELWFLTGDLFQQIQSDDELIQNGIVFKHAELKPLWDSKVSDVFSEAEIKLPNNQYMLIGGRSGKHTEHLGHILSEMQSLARSMPDAVW